MGMMGRGLGMLLQNQGVQEELKMDQEQIAKAKEVAQKVQSKHQGDFSQLQNLSPTERREKMQQMGREVNEEILKDLGDTLKPEQVKRLKQIELQARGIQAFLDPEVASALDLNDDQKSKIKSISDDLMAEMTASRPGGGAGGGAGGGRPDFQAMQQKMNAMRKEGMKKVTGVLDEKQKKTWEEMTGKPFEVRFQRPGAGA
jgi:hypothetical protein